MILLDVFENLKNMLQQALQWVVSLMPDSPFKLLDNSPVAQYLPYLNWFIPFDFIIATLETWLVAIGVYYAWSVLLRWVKAIN